MQTRLGAVRLCARTAPVPGLAAGRCRFYERPQRESLLAWTIWIPGCHLIVLNEEMLDWGPTEQVGS